jgi:glycosyltransferase involved in cell wall biosynthesis
VADLLLVQYGAHQFLKRDQKLLEREFSCDLFEFRQPPIQFLLDSVKFLAWFWRRRKTAKAVFTRFADYHAFVASLFAGIFHKPFVIVVGGYDAVWMPRYDFGVYRKWKSRAAASFALRHADYILPVDESLVRGVNEYSDPEPRKEGILEYVDGITGTVITIHNGYDPTIWKRTDGIDKQDEFLSVANVSTYIEWIRKGINYFVLLADRMPQHRFCLVGMDRIILEQFTGKPVPANLEILPQLRQEELAKVYSRAKVYVQLSLSEGMPNALCESMLCECVPVGSNVNGIPNIIADTGIIVKKQNIEEMETALRLALQRNSGKDSRRRIMDRFPPEKRREALTSVFRQAIAAGGTR